MVDTLLLLALNGLIWGLIIALIALGLSIIFGLLDIINIAHGDFFMVGTVLAWSSLSVTGNFWIGFLVAPLIGFLLGAIIQRLVIQPRPHRIDAVRRMDDLAQLHVGGRKAKRPAALLAMFDDGVDDPVPAQRLARRRHVAPLDRLADA